MIRSTLLVAAGCALLISGPAAGRTQTKPATTPEQVKRLIGCRSIADAAQRLACFDRETTNFDQALARKDIVVADRQATTAARRSLFGFSIPSLGGLFGGDDDEVKEIESTVTAIGRNPEGGYTIRLADGSTWTQTDDTIIALAPRRGDKVKVRRRTLGAFSLSVKGQPGVRVRRIG